MVGNRIEPIQDIYIYIYIYIIYIYKYFMAILETMSKHNILYIYITCFGIPHKLVERQFKN